jgi:hypothetical protein
MTIIIPNSFADKTGVVRLEDLDENFSQIATDLNTEVTSIQNTVDSIEDPVAMSLIFGPDTPPQIEPGSVVQCVVKRYDGQTSYTTGTSTSGVEITDLRVSITPKYSNSLIYCIFQIFGEGQSTHDYIYRVFKNGAVPTGTYAGFNTVSGDQHYSGIAQALPYEGDYNSTPYATTMQYHDYPGTSGTAITYAPGVKDSYGTSRVYFVNRTVGTPQNGYEVGVSFATAWEIAQ